MHCTLHVRDCTLLSSGSYMHCWWGRPGWWWLMWTLSDGVLQRRTQWAALQDVFWRLHNSNDWRHQCWHVSTYVPWCTRRGGSGFSCQASIVKNSANVQPAHIRSTLYIDHSLMAATSFSWHGRVLSVRAASRGRQWRLWVLRERNPQEQLHQCGSHAWSMPTLSWKHHHRGWWRSWHRIVHTGFVHPGSWPVVDLIITRTLNSYVEINFISTYKCSFCEALWAAVAEGAL